ncbi:MAG TPA: pilin [Candidatus Paceibacterota bacterium]|nr:pilin [Candidatus Paceibacterota bacterium]
MKRFFVIYRDVILTLVSLLVMLIPAVSTAAGTHLAVDTPIVQQGNNTIVSQNASNSSCPSGSNCLENPLGSITSVCQLMLALLNAVMVIGIPVAILFIIWAGFKFIIAQGNPGELGEAKTNFYHVIIGIAIFLGASLIASVIINTLRNLGVQGINSC